MCRTAAAAQPPGAANALNMAVLILLVPALALFSGVFLLAFLYQASSSADKSEDDL
jgi:hypothetical protein